MRSHSLLVGLGIGLILGAIVGWYVIPSRSSAKIPVPGPRVNNISTDRQVEFKADMRKLWVEHAGWTRMYLLSAASDSSDLDATTNRLLKNQEDIGNAIKPYYGNQAGDNLTKLLKEHILLAADLTKAAKDNDQNALKTANDMWYANADQIAEFLSKANPNWPKETVASEMHSHLDLTKQEAVDILGKKGDSSVTDFDKIQNQILGMADMFSDGVIKQYPDKF